MLIPDGRNNRSLKDQLYIRYGTWQVPLYCFSIHRLTTGLFCMPLEEGQKIVESLDGVEALWCTTDGQVITSSGWSSHEKK